MFQPDAESSEDAFEAAAAYVAIAAGLISDDDLLTLYGLYKQATCGPCDIACPPFYDRKGKAKWTAWHSCNTLSREEAQLRYVQHLQVVSPGWADQDAGSNLHGAGGQGPVFSRMADAEADSDSPVMAPSGASRLACNG